ncbi:MAG: diguanylate cyclase [Verrucomicrobia bacterium]|nr:MAG: diguanylate cyclase [Verrucomicrobiota bacterium]
MSTAKTQSRIFPTIKVLLVEDEPITAATTRRILTRRAEERFIVLHTSLLSEALEILERESIDIVLLDLNLPDSEGLETLARVTEHAPEIAVVVLTATEEDEMGVRAVQLGAQDFLVKGSFNDAFLQRCVLYSVERHRLQRTIRQLAILDELTGLYNRRGFHSLNEDILARVRDGEARGFIAYFDLDDFKGINDSLGHQAGDEALIEFAVTLREVFRKDTLLCRLGGDEFLAMGIETRPGLVAQTIETLDKILEERNNEPGRRYHLKTSRGIHYFTANEAHDIALLLAIADARLYRNKQERHAAGLRQRRASA